MAAHAEIFQHPLKQTRILFQRISGKRRITRNRLRLGKEMQRRHFKRTAILEEGRLRFALGARTRPWCRSSLFHAGLTGTRWRRIVPFLTSKWRAIIHIERWFIVRCGRRTETRFTTRHIAARNMHIVKIFLA